MDAFHIQLHTARSILAATGNLAALRQNVAEIPADFDACWLREIMGDLPVAGTSGEIRQELREQEDTSSGYLPVENTLLLPIPMGVTSPQPPAAPPKAAPASQVNDSHAREEQPPTRMTLSSTVPAERTTPAKQQSAPSHTAEQPPSSPGGKMIEEAASVPVIPADGEPASITSVEQLPTASMLVDTMTCSDLPADGSSVWSDHVLAAALPDDPTIALPAGAAASFTPDSTTTTDSITTTAQSLLPSGSTAVLPAAEGQPGSTGTSTGALRAGEASAGGSGSELMLSPPGVGGVFVPQQVSQGGNRILASPQAARQIITQVVSSLRLTLNHGQRELSVRLDPPELGTVHIVVTTQPSGELLARIEASHPATREMLQRQVQELQAALREQEAGTSPCVVTFDLSGDFPGQQGHHAAPMLATWSGPQTGGGVALPEVSDIPVALPRHAGTLDYFA